jgi:hypothetical protein
MDMKSSITNFYYILSPIYHLSFLGEKSYLSFTMKTYLSLVVLFSSMHFNKEVNHNLQNHQKSIAQQDFLVLDTLKVDDHSRITFTKRIRNVLPIQIGDIIGVYQSKKNGEIILNIQREGDIIDAWVLKRAVEQNY